MRSGSRRLSDPVTPAEALPEYGLSTMRPRRGHAPLAIAVRRVLHDNVEDKGLGADHFGKRRPSEAAPALGATREEAVAP
ncbi:MAG: hypothetical protein ACXV5Q_14695 [Frankiaceae bacterium]